MASDDSLRGGAVQAGKDVAWSRGAWLVPLPCHEGRLHNKEMGTVLTWRSYVWRGGDDAVAVAEQHKAEEAESIAVRRMDDLGSPVALSSWIASGLPWTASPPPSPSFPPSSHDCGWIGLRRKPQGWLGLEERRDISFYRWERVACTARCGAGWRGAHPGWWPWPHGWAWLSWCGATGCAVEREKREREVAADNQVPPVSGTGGGEVGRPTRAERLTDRQELRVVWRSYWQA
jgi:hypothetical protein